MNEATESVSRAHKEIKLSAKDIERFWSKVDKDGPTQPHMTTPCWVWTGGKCGDGYGSFRLGMGMLKAHRISWVLSHGQIPHDESSHGLCVCHRCDVKTCCRPDHIFLGTHNDNMADMVNKGRGKHVCGDEHFSRKHPERLARGDRNGSHTHPERVARGERHGSHTHPERLSRGASHFSRLHPERMARGDKNGCSKLNTAQIIEIRSIYKTGGTSHRQLAAQFGVSHTVIGGIIKFKAWAHIPSSP